jgi:hypothetical protein
MPKSQNQDSGVTEITLDAKAYEFDALVKWVAELLPRKKYDSKTTQLKRIRARINTSIKNGKLKKTQKNGIWQIQTNEFLVWAYNVKGWEVLRSQIDKLITIVSVSGVSAIGVCGDFSESGGVTMIPQDKSQENLIRVIKDLQLKAQHDLHSEKKKKSENARRNALKRNIK